jgi:hypothetical protein
VIVTPERARIDGAAEFVSERLFGGERGVLRAGAPRALISELDGKVWQKTADKSAVSAYRRSMTVISTQLFEGRTLVHVLHDGQPEAGFEPVEPNLEDVYFSILRGDASATETHHAA